MRRKPGHSNPTCEGGRRCHSLSLMGTAWLSTYRVLLGGLHPITDRWERALPETASQTHFSSSHHAAECISNITAAPPKPPGVHMDHSPKHIKGYHCHFSPHTTLPTNSSFAGHLMSPCLFPTQVGQVQEHFSLQLFLLEIKPLHPLHCSWKSDWIPLWFTIYMHSSSLPSSQLFWISTFHDSSYIIPPAQTRKLQIMAAD